MQWENDPYNDRNAPGAKRTWEIRYRIRRPWGLSPQKTKRFYKKSEAESFVIPPEWEEVRRVESAVFAW